MPQNNTCDKCGAVDEGIGFLARAFRLVEIRNGRSDPGNLCGSCAGGITGNRIADEILARDKFLN